MFGETTESAIEYFSMQMHKLIATTALNCRKRKRKSGDNTAVCTTNRTPGRSTLKRRNTDPAEEWDKVLIENGEQRPKLEKDIDIIHNVPLDPRATLDKPLNIPKQAEYVTLQRKMASIV